MWLTIGNWLAGLFSGPILNGLLDAYRARLAAGNTADRIAADLAARELAVESREQELRTQLLIAEQGRWYTAVVRPAFMAVILAYFAKVVVWDKVFGLGTTDAIGGDVGNWIHIMIASYFGGRSIEKVARIIKRG